MGNPDEALLAGRQGYALASKTKSIMSSYERVTSEMQRLLLKLESIAELLPEDKDALLGLPLRLKAFPEDADIVREGDRPVESCLILEGYCCRYKIVQEGKRQIMSFHTPGDMPDLQSIFLKTMDHSVGTLVPTKVAFIPHQSLIALSQQFPRIAAAFWRDTLIDAAIFREWMVGLGRRDAYQRIAHLICEMALRTKAVGLVNGDTFDFPVTQAEIGDALGLSNVHVNRVIMDLRKNALIAMRGSTVTIHDWDGLKQAGDFDPLYLHQDHELAA